MGSWIAILLNSFYRESRNSLQEWIDDLDTIEFLAVLHVFGQHNAATALPGGVEHQRIPVGDPVQPVEVDRRENIRGDRLDNVEARIGLDPLPSQSRIETELPRGVHKIFLQYLQRNHACALRFMLQDQLRRSLLLRWVRKVIAVEKDIRVQK